MELNEIVQALSVFGNNQPLPREALAEAAREKEALTPVLMDAVEKIYEKICSSGKDAYGDPAYDLSLYGIFLLAQFQEQSAFPMLLRILKLDTDGLDIMLGDTVGDMGNILYSTYNGDFSAVEEVIADDGLDPFARGAALRMLAGLLRDGRLPREHLLRFLRERLTALGDSEDEETFGGLLADVIADNDLYELTEDVREAFRQEKIDVMQLGDFDGFFDYLYNEAEYPDHVRSIEDTAQELEKWACFNEEDQSSKKMDDMRELLSWKVGRNDPCPCGSGKKFKKCCLPKQEELRLEFGRRRPAMPQDNYPPVERQDGRPGLSDFYSQDAIKVDQLAYRALSVLRLPPFQRWGSERKLLGEARKSLWHAFEEFQKICDKEGFETLEAYDENYKLHYLCSEWLEVLRNLLIDTGDDRYQEVQDVLSRMGN